MTRASQGGRWLASMQTSELELASHGDGGPSVFVV